MNQVWDMYMPHGLGLLPCTAPYVLSLSADGHSLYVFSVSGVGNGRDCQVPITPGWGSIVGVVGMRGQEVCVVREKGYLELFSQYNLIWKGAGNSTYMKKLTHVGQR